MPPKVKKNISLGAILRSQCLKPTQKFSGALISDVYAFVATPQDLEDLLASQYFERVLWRFFHPDISNSHLELLLEVAGYEHSAHGTLPCLKLILLDEQKADQLMLRLLATILASSGNTHKLEAKTYLFLRCVMLICPEYLFRNRLYSKWKDVIFLRYAMEMKDNATPQDFELVECFLLFCLTCIASKTELGQFIKDLVFPAYYRSADNGRVRHLAEMLQFTADDESTRSSGLEVRLLWSKSLLPKNIFRPLKDYDTFDDVFEDLANLPPKDIDLLASSWGYTGAEKDSKILASIIVCISIGSKYDWYTLQMAQTFTEETLFDVFEKNSLVSYFPEFLPPNISDDTNTEFRQLQCARACALRKRTSQLILSSLSRLEISDPSKPQGIKGSSKYFSRIEVRSSVGGCAKIYDLSELFLKDLKPLDRVVLLVLQKPNKYGGLERMAKFGLARCVLATVNKVCGYLEVVRLTPELDKDFNAIVKLNSVPFETNPFADLTPPSIILSESVRQKKKPKKDKLKQELAENKTLSADEILKSMFDNRITQLQSFPPIVSLALVTQFLRKYHEQLQKDLYVHVVVLPSIAAVDLFPLLPEWAELTFKFDTDNESVQRTRARINSGLAQVSILADYLGLSEYDFAGSIQNALMLYEIHMLPKWNQFITTISESNYGNYPFGELFANSFDEYKAAALEKYTEICSLFTDLQKYLYFDKIRESFKADDLKKLRAALLDKAKLIVVSSDDIVKVSKQVRTIITYDSMYSPKVSDDLIHLIATGGLCIKTGSIIEYSKFELEEPFVADKLQKTPRIPGFERSFQRVKVPATNEQANLEEAEFCLQIYRFMRALGFPRSLVLIVCGSPYTKLLITELHEEQKGLSDEKLPILQMVDEMFPCEIIIASTHGTFTTAHYFKAVQSCLRGLFLIGADSREPFNLYTGKLEIRLTERYGEDTSDDSLALKINDSRHLAQQVANINKQNDTHGNEK